ncbi:MAG: phosphoheptose isomerase [Peptococcaceae bacterium BRH_c4a]|nr:MAG: phosphoheptose isomerase [Peptococcaceae bacterium BRH_c4a]
MEKQEGFYQKIVRIAGVLVDCYKAGGKLLICGNGGSAADSQHIATELVSRFFLERKALDAEALTVNTSTLTAVGNDYSFDVVFSRQIEAKGREGDVLIAISTSGNSKNIVEAIRVAKSRGMTTIGLTGNNKESTIYKMTDYCVAVPSESTPRIQEAHILIGHLICEYVERSLFKEN